MTKLITRNGNIVPPVGLGTFPFQGDEMCEVVLNALKIGYRLIDTSDDYRGESGVGLAVDKLADIGLNREDIFLLTKISDDDSYDDDPLTGVYFNKNSKFMKRHSVEEIVREKVEKSLYEMHTDYIDALLIHQPYPNYSVEIWKVLIELKREGVVRYIGVSNYQERHIESLIKETGVCPEINESYASPVGIKQSLVDYCIDRNCQFVTYSPLMEVSTGKITPNDLQPIMSKYHKSLAQIVIRWNIERGCIPLPKSKKVSRLAENFDVFDFQLTTDEMKMINTLNYDYQHFLESLMCAGI